MSKKFKVPWVISNERIEDEDYIETYEAAPKHGKHLSKAGWHVMVAHDLATVLETSLGQSHEDIGMTASTVVGQIKEHLDEIRRRLNKHDMRHSNLFMAHFLGGES